MCARIVVCAVCLAAAASAQEDRPRTLAAFLPNGAAFVVRAQAPAAASDRLVGTPFGKAICEGSFAEYVRSAPWLRRLETASGLTVAETVKQLAGGEAIFAAYVGELDPPGPPRVQWLLLLEGLDGVDAAPVVERLVNALVAEGELTAAAAPAGAAPPFKFFRAKQGGDVVVAPRGNRTLAASSFDLATKVMDLAAGKGSDSVLANPSFRETCRDLVKDADFAMFLDTRVLRGPRRPGDPPPALFVHLLPNVFHWFKGIAWAYRVHGNGISGRTRMVFEEPHDPKTSEIIRAWHDEPPERFSLARHFPVESVLGGMAVQIKSKTLSRFFEANRASARKSLDAFRLLLGPLASLIDRAMESIGPEAALVFTDEDQTDDPPIEATLIVQIDKKATSTFRNLLRGLYALLKLTGKSEIGADTKLTRTGTTLLLSSKLADLGVTPAIAVTPSALVLSTSAEFAKTMSGWLAEPPADNLGDVVPPFKIVCTGSNLAALGGWLARHSDRLSRLSRDASSLFEREVSPEEAKKAIVAAAQLLAQMDFVISHGVSAPNAFEIITELSVGR